MKEKNKTDILKQSERYKKINTDDMKTESFERKPYLTNLRMDQSRTKFKMKTKKCEDELQKLPKKCQETMAVF